MKFFCFFSSFIFFVSISSARERSLSSSSSESKGFFSIGLLAGMSKSGFLNSDGDFSGYQSLTYGLDMDVLVWKSGDGGLRVFGSYLIGDGKNSADTTNKIKSEETVWGLKINLNSYIYLAAGLGRAQQTLTSTSNSNQLNVSQNITRLGLGLEIPISHSLFFGTEATYRSGPVKKSENPSFTENSFYEGSGLVLKLIWSPPSVTNIFVYK